MAKQATRVADGALTIPSNPDLESLLSESKDVQLARPWLVAPKIDTGLGFTWVAMLLLSRSENVRSLFPGSANNDPAHVWAAQLLADIPREAVTIEQEDDTGKLVRYQMGGLIQSGNVPIDARKDSVIYLFEPGFLAAFFAAAFHSQNALMIRCNGFENAYSKKQGRSVNRRRWQAKVRPIRMAPNPEAKASILLPRSTEDIDASAQLAAGAIDVAPEK